MIILFIFNLRVECYILYDSYYFVKWIKTLCKKKPPIRKDEGLFILLLFLYVTRLEAYSDTKLE
jgi:hypothetical protein